MSDFVMKGNSGNLFKNVKKEKETHPDYRGEVLVNGKKMQISAWINEGKNGKFMSLSFQEPYVKPEAEQKPEPKKYDTSSFADMDDNIPF